MNLFDRRRRALRPKHERIFCFESLEQRALLAADFVGESESSVDVVPDFHLVDVNSLSQTYTTEQSPRDLLGQTSAFYFAHFTRGYCRRQFGYLDLMQNELRSEYPDKPLHIVAINEYGHESGNPLVMEGLTAPILQDVDANNNGSSDVWHDLWDISYRDVKILNQQNEVVGTVNLTPPVGYDLGEETNYDALKQILTDVAHERPFWQNPKDPTDVNNDQRTSALDALQCINELIYSRIGDSDPNLPLPMPPLKPTPYLDVNGDGLITANDALRVINRLIKQPSTPEGNSLRAEGESFRERACVIDDSPGESSCSQFAANASQPLELTAQPTAPHAFTGVSDVRGEDPHDDHGVDTNGRPSESILRPTSPSISASDANSSPLSCRAVDSVFGCDDDLLLADAIARSLIHHQSAI